MKKTTLNTGTGYSLKKSASIFNWITCVFFLSLIFQSCKKDSIPKDPVVIPPPQQADRTFNVAFDNSTISINLIDSAHVIFKKEGSNSRYIQYLERKGDKLEADIGTIANGEWTANLTLFARAAGDTATRQYAQLKTFTVTKTSGSPIIAGPNGTMNDNWKPRVVLADQKRIVQVVVALDATDPYFEIRLHDRNWQGIRIERAALYRDLGNELIAGDRWICPGNCATNDDWIINNTAFATFAATMKQKSWNNGEIDVELTGNTPDKKLSFFYAYKR